MKATRAQGPHIPAEYQLADAIAVQALVRGEADRDQQQRVMRWIIEQASGMYEFHFYPGDRETSFALGRSFVGQQIVKLSKLNTSSLRRENASS
jgi:hypothetical protein